MGAGSSNQNQLSDPLDESTGVLMYLLLIEVPILYRVLVPGLTLKFLQELVPRISYRNMYQKDFMLQLQDPCSFMSPWYKSFFLQFKIPVAFCQASTNNLQTIYDPRLEIQIRIISNRAHNFSV